MAKSKALGGCWAAGFVHADDRTTRTVGTGAVLGGFLDGMANRKSRGRVARHGSAAVRHLGS